MTWQPIDTAPRDGTAILGYEPGSGMAVCKYMTTIDRFTDCHGYIIYASRWQPLPEPPENA